MKRFTLTTGALLTGLIVSVWAPTTVAQGPAGGGGGAAQAGPAAGGAMGGGNAPLGGVIGDAAGASVLMAGSCCRPAFGGNVVGLAVHETEDCGGS